MTVKNHGAIVYEIQNARKFSNNNTLWAQSSFWSGFISRIQEKPET